MREHLAFYFVLCTVCCMAILSPISMSHLVYLLIDFGMGFLWLRVYHDYLPWVMISSSAATAGISHLAPRPEPGPLFVINYIFGQDSLAETGLNDWLLKRTVKKKGECTYVWQSTDKLKIIFLCSTNNEHWMSPCANLSFAYVPANNTKTPGFIFWENKLLSIYPHFT